MTNRKLAKCERLIEKLKDRRRTVAMSIKCIESDLLEGARAKKSKSWQASATDALSAKKSQEAALLSALHALNSAVDDEKNHRRLAGVAENARVHRAEKNSTDEYHASIIEPLWY